MSLMPILTESMCPNQYALGYSGKRINSLSPGTVSNDPSCQSALALAIRSFELETKFHQIYRSPTRATDDPDSNNGNVERDWTVAEEARTREIAYRVITSRRANITTRHWQM